MSRLEVLSSARRREQGVVDGEMSAQSAPDAATIDAAYERGVRDGITSGRASMREELTGEHQRAMDTAAACQQQVDQELAALDATLVAVGPAVEQMAKEFDTALHSATLAMAERMLVSLASDEKWSHALIDTLKQRYQPDKLEVTLTPDVYEALSQQNWADRGVTLIAGRAGQVPSARSQSRGGNFEYNLSKLLTELLGVATAEVTPK